MGCKPLKTVKNLGGYAMALDHSTFVVSCNAITSQPIHFSARGNLDDPDGKLAVLDGIYDPIASLADPVTFLG
jgi:hypothetical protein